MKYILAVVVGLSLISCASKKAGETATKAAETKTNTPAPAVEAAKKDAKATAKAAANEQTISCESKADKRELAISNKDGHKCVLTYTKFGKAQDVATSDNSSTHCQTKLEKIKGNLEGAGFTCK